MEGSSTVSDDDFLSAAPNDAEEFLTDWFDRLTDSGFASDVFLGGLADDLVWTATGSSPISGRYDGLPAYVEGVYRPLDERLSTWPQPRVERIVAAGEWGVVEFSSTGGVGKNGTDYSMRYCRVMHVRDNRVDEVIGYYDQVKVVELFS